MPDKAQNSSDPLKGRRDLALQAISSAIRAIVERHGGKTKVSRRTSIPIRTINNFTRIINPTSPSPSDLLILSEALGVPIEAFFDAKSSTGPSPVSRSGSLDPGYYPIPLVDVRASAGHGRVASLDELPQGEMIAFREEFARSIGVSLRYAQALWADGDSMAPTIQDGDLIIIDRSIDRIVNDGIYVIVISGMVKLKRLQLRLDGSVMIISDNKAYGEERVPPEDLHELQIEGQVKWGGRNI